MGWKWASIKLIAGLLLGLIHENVGPARLKKLLVRELNLGQLRRGREVHERDFGGLAAAGEDTRKQLASISGSKRVGEGFGRLCWRSCTWSPKLKVDWGFRWRSTSCGLEEVPSMGQDELLRTFAVDQAWNDG